MVIKFFSQQDEDGIIDEIFNRIGFGSKNLLRWVLKQFVECNTTNLLLQDWTGLFLKSKNVEIIKKNFS